jgi:curli production assembly/transport component CsgG
MKADSVQLGLRSPVGKRRVKAAPLVGLLASLALAGCEKIGVPWVGPYEAQTTVMTAQNIALRDLPEPAKRVRVAVYDFPDLTGQFRERETVQTMSRAVSQGGSAMLINALRDAGNGEWFSVLDRSNLDQLLRERQIVTEMRRIYRGESELDPSAIGPMRHAGVVLQGGIIGFDSNIQTGGTGARFLGIGASTRWKLDIVTVSLRAVSNETGEVLASVIVEKPIASTIARGDVFRYIALDELAEVETGTAINEPKQLALQKAIEKAVYSIVLEGADIGLWTFADQAAAEPLRQQYRAQLVRETDRSPEAAKRASPETRNPTRVVDTAPLPAEQRGVSAP